MLTAALEGEGRVGVVVPHGVFFRGGQEGNIRESTIKENLLSAVIGLPANLFYGTGIPAALLIFDKARKPNGKDDVLFIDASRECEQSTNQNRLRGQDIPRYVDTFEPELGIDIPAVQKEIEAIEAELDKTRNKMNEHLKELGFR